ncbi:MAG: hypothetical protein Q8K60_00780, partial [Parachlamydiaceae bacterium]|nr:hypothetical protein [Parachlamydiaceae bacterium]
SDDKSSHSTFTQKLIKFGVRVTCHRFPKLRLVEALELGLDRVLSEATFRTENNLHTRPKIEYQGFHTVENIKFSIQINLEPDPNESDF